MVIDAYTAEALVRECAPQELADDLGELRWYYFACHDVDYSIVRCLGRYHPRVMGADVLVDEMTTEALVDAMERAAACYWFDVPY